MLNFKFWRQKAIIFLVAASLLVIAILYQIRRERSNPTARTVITPTRVPARQFSISTIAYIPVDGKLQERKVSPQVKAAQDRSYGDRTPLLNEVIRLAPKYFPPNARVITVKQGFTSDGRPSHFIINLNRAFSNVKFWRGRKRRDSISALHALARNVAFINSPKGVPLPVQFVIEGKSVDAIGAFDADRPLLPDRIIRPS